MRSLGQALCRGFQGLRQVRGPRFHFSDLDDLKKDIAKKAFLDKINNEIDYLQGNLFDMSDYNTYFAERKWSINFNPKFALIEFKRKEGPYEIAVSVPIRFHQAPIEKSLQMELDENSVKPDENQNVPLTELSVHLRKQGSRWFVGEYVVYRQQVSRATNFFCDKYLGLPVTIMSIGLEGYNGPCPSSLQTKLNEAIAKLMQSCGVDAQVLLNMAMMATNKEQDLMHEWLKDLKRFFE